MKTGFFLENDIKALIIGTNSKENEHSIMIEIHDNASKSVSTITIEDHKSFKCLITALQTMGDQVHFLDKPRIIS